MIGRDFEVVAEVDAVEGGVIVDVCVRDPVWDGVELCVTVELGEGVSDFDADEEVVSDEVAEKEVVGVAGGVNVFDIVWVIDCE